MSFDYNPKMEVAYAYKNIKEAALYFDYVRPFVYYPPRLSWVHLPMLMPFLDIDLPFPSPFSSKFENPEEVLQKILPPPLMIKNKVNENYSESIEALANLLIKIHNKKAKKKDEKEFERIWVRMSKKINYGGYVDVDFGHRPSKNLGSSKNIDSINFMISGIASIDVKNIEWDQIIEFREDKENVKAIRDLRLFFYENFSEKSKNYIEDKLGQIADKHDEAVKAWKLGTTISALEMCINSKFFIPTLASTVVSITMGAPVPITSAFASGLVLEIGNISLKIAKKKREISKIINNHPIRYINKLEENFTEP